jgi:putative transposase
MGATEDYRTGRHRVFGLHVHLVFVTKYRRNVLTGEHHDFLHEVFAKVCADFGANLVECNGEDDHVHLLVEYPPQVAVSKLVNSLKGVSSRRLRQRYRVRTHGDHLWSPSYFAASCGGAPLSIIRQYVENQRRPA